MRLIVYADKPETIDALLESIWRVIADKQRQLLQNVGENCASQLKFIRVKRGDSLP